METFPYQPYESRPTPGDPSNFHHRPMLLVTLYGQKAKFPTIGLVDTGAVETIIPVDYWHEIDPLVIEPETAEFETANGGKIKVIYGLIDFAIKINEIAYRWTVKVGFSDQRDEVVLGDAGFLRHFAVHFDRRARKLTVHEPAKLPPSFVHMIPTGEIGGRFHDIRNMMLRRKKIRPKPRRRPT